MQLATYFQPNRLAQLLKLEVLTGNRRTLLAALAVISILLMTAIAWAADGDRDTVTFHESFFPAVFMIGGFLFTGSIFKDFDEPTTTHLYLMLPASNEEKFLSKLLISSLGYAIAATAAYWIFSLITNSIIYQFFEIEVWTFNPFEGINWLIIKLYLVLQSIYLLGAILFRRYAALKTAFVTPLFPAILGGFTYLLARIIFAKYFDGWKVIDEPENVQINQGFQDLFIDGSILTFLNFLLWVVLPLFFWTVTYFKLKEKEIS